MMNDQTPSVTEQADSTARTIEARGTYQPADLFVAQLVYWKPRPVFIGLAVILVLGILCGLVLMWTDGELEWVDVVLPLLLFYVVLRLTILPYRDMRRLWRKTPVLQEDRLIQVTPEGLHIVTGMSDDRLTWDSIIGYRFSSKLILLYIAPGQYIMLPRRFFDDDKTWYACRRVVHRQLGQCRGCGYRLRGSTGPTCPECGVAIES